MKVTVQEILDTLTNAIDLCLPEGEPYALTTYEVLMERIKAHGIAPPDGMVLVPIEPTAEMISAAEEAYMPFGDMGMALICGNLAAPKQENTNE